MDQHMLKILRARHLHVTYIPDFCSSVQASPSKRHRLMVGTFVFPAGMVTFACWYRLISLKKEENSCVEVCFVSFFFFFDGHLYLCIHLLLHYFESLILISGESWSKTEKQREVNPQWRSSCRPLTTSMDNEARTAFRMRVFSHINMHVFATIGEAIVPWIFINSLIVCCQWFTAKFCEHQSHFFMFSWIQTSPIKLTRVLDLQLNKLPN